MNRPLFGALGVAAVLALTVGSCKNDPLSDLDGTPAAVVTNFSYLQMAIGATAQVTASIVDGRATPLEVPITFTPCTADVTTAIDTSYHPVPVTSARAIVTAVTANPSCVRVSGGGLEDSVTVAILPQAFGGTVSSATPQGGDTLTISSTAVLKFDTATVAVTFGGGVAGTVVSKTADQVRVLVPFSSPGPLTIAGINVTYVTGLIVALPTTTTVTQTGNRWAALGTNSWQTAPDVSWLIPSAAGQTRHAILPLPAGNSAICPEVVMAFGSTGPCAILKITVGAATNMRFRVDWQGTALAPDVDLLVCSDTTLANFDGNTGAPCGVAGFGAATGAKPQITGATVVVAAGTYWVVIENFDGTPSANHFLSIIRP